MIRENGWGPFLIKLENRSDVFIDDISFCRHLKFLSALENDFILKRVHPSLSFTSFSVNFKKYEKKAADISASKTLEVI